MIVLMQIFFCPSGDAGAVTNYPQPLGVLEAVVTSVHNNVQSG